MEINITVFIQALIFLMLFLFLSKTLFVPLQKIVSTRDSLVSNEEENISLTNNKIVYQKYHIKKILFLVENRMKRKHKYLSKSNMLEKQKIIKREWFKNNEEHKSLMLKLKNEIITSRLRLMTYKKFIKKDIIKKLINDR